MDLERVLVNEPCSYDKYLVVFQRLQEDESISDSKFSHVSFWVQLHNLPLRRMTEEAAEAIGRSIGEVEKVANSDDGRGGENCMRVRVRMEITSPLCRGRLVKLEEGKRCWVAFRYERLPNFCYWCGCLDHGEKDCDVGLQQRKSGSMEEHQFGAWLRASSDRPPRKTVVMVPGHQPKGGEKEPRTESCHHPTSEKTESHKPQPATDGAPDSTPINLEADMEIEPNPGTTDLFCFQKSNITDFNAQLYEIDQAINYVPEKEKLKENILVPPMPSTLNMEKENNIREPPMHCDEEFLPRAPLCDISNGPLVHVDPKKKAVKWKKLACEHMPSALGPIQAQSPKRNVSYEEGDLVQKKK